MLHVALPLERPETQPVLADILPIEAPPPVPEAPRGSIHSRAVYPDPGYVEWVLPSGANVVHKQVPDTDGTWLYGFAPVDGPTRSEATPDAAASRLFDGPGVQVGVLGGERLVAARAPTLGDALSSVAGLFGGGAAAATDPWPWGLAAAPPESIGEAGAPRVPSHPVARQVRGVRESLGAFTFVLISSDPSERVEALVGSALGTLSPRSGRTVDAGAVPTRADGGPSFTTARLQADGARRDAPALDVLAAAVRQRLGSADEGIAVFAHVHPRIGVARLEVAGSGGDEAVPVDGDGGWQAPFSEAEVRDARARAAASVCAGDPAVWARLLADLYREAGPFRPARNPAELSQYADRLLAVSTASVNALADRLRSSSSPSLSR